MRKQFQTAVLTKFLSEDEIKELERKYNENKTRAFKSRFPMLELPLTKEEEQALEMWLSTEVIDTQAIADVLGVPRQSLSYRMPVIGIRKLYQSR